MENPAAPRPRVSRETRLLFATVILSVVALWILARLRFPEQPPSVNPVAPVLTQLAPTPAFGDLASVVSDVQARVLSPFVAVRLEPASVARRTGSSVVAALRVRDDVAVALLDPAEGSWRDRSPQGASLLNVDRATGLALLKVPSRPTPTLSYWSPGRLASPRYLLSTVTVPDAISLRPVFVSVLASGDSVPWEAPLWTVPSSTDLTAGSFVFGTTGAFAGLVVPHEGGAAILPPEALSSAVDRVLKQRQGNPGWLGLNVQPITPALSAATGASRGLIVSWVDPLGPAAGSIQVADVLESMDDMSSALTEEPFRARVARLLAGDAITLQVRRGEMRQPVRLTAAEQPAPAPSLGLTMRRVPGGTEVVRVEPRSAADLSGIRAGDIITFAAGMPAPTPRQIARAFSVATDGTLLVGIDRAGAHLLLPVSKP